MIVFDLFEAVDQDNAVAEGKRKAVLVMSRDARRHAATDGWGYALFAPGKQQNSLDAKGSRSAMPAISPARIVDSCSAPGVTDTG